MIVREAERLHLLAVPVSVLARISRLLVISRTTAGIAPRVPVHDLVRTPETGPEAAARVRMTVIAAVATVRHLLASTGAVQKTTTGLLAAMTGLTEAIVLPAATIVATAEAIVLLPASTVAAEVTVLPVVASTVALEATVLLQALTAVVAGAALQAASTAAAEAAPGAAEVEALVAAGRAEEKTNTLLKIFFEVGGERGFSTRFHFKTQAKKMSKFFFISLCFIFSLSYIQAQNSSDALRYSNFEVGGTARSIGVGGALSALGADFSVLSTNPAGMAWYRSSDFVFSPSLYTSNTSSRLLNDEGGSLSEESRTNFNLNSFGIVVASAPRNNNWKTINFGIGFNRLANFHNDFYYEGNSAGSIINRFQEQANSGAISDFESGLAIDALALFDNEGDGIYESDFDNVRDASIFRSQDVMRRGAINELVFSLAGNYREKLMFGATVGVPFVNYREEKEYREDDTADNVPAFHELIYSEELNTTGAGFNLKLGMIYRATQAIRLGLAVHTPTAYSLQDNFRSVLAYSFTDGNGQTFPIDDEFESPDGLFDYKLRTPWRFIGGMSFVYRKLGFLSAEIEYLNFSKNKFKYDGFADAEDDANQAIGTSLSNAVRLRFGGELAYDIFRFRAGLKLMQSPLEGDDTINNTISGGIGFRNPKFYMDLAYQRNSIDEIYTPYLVSASFPDQLVRNETNNNQVVLTMGFRF